jgi:glutamine amidotransferase
MCRLLAYLGPEVSLEELLLTPPYSLLRQTYEPRFQQRGRMNADGFGAGWYHHPHRPEPALYRRAVPMWGDASFASMAGLIRSTAVLASVRNATVPSLIEESSTAPFSAGPWLFAHNGEVAGFTTGGRGTLLGGLSAHRAAGVRGTADSEVLFALVLDRLDAGVDPAGALCAVVDTVLSGTGGRLNMVLTDGFSIAATACGDSLYVLERRLGDEGAVPSVVVASEPFDDDPAWREVADGSVVTADPSRGVSIGPIPR